MKILILANFGMGLYNFRKELLEELINKNYEVIVCFPEDSYSNDIKKLGCRFISTDVDRRGTSPFKDLKLLLSYLKIMTSEKPNVVLTYTIKPNVYGGIASQITGVPYLTNITGLGTSIESKGFLGKLSLLMYKIGLQNSFTVFFQNQENKKKFNDERITISDSILLPGSGVNLDEFKYEEYPLNSEKIVVLFVGRLMKSKGIDELLSAVKIIKEKYKFVEFHLVGFSEEDYLNEIHKLVENNIICYHGQQKDIRIFLKKCHVLIQPSHHEGMSNVLLEASATGRPVIASNIPGCQEIFEDGKTGFGFEVKNTESLVSSIEKFIQLSYEKKKQMGMAARQKIEIEFDRQIVVQEYLKKIMEINGGD